MTDTVTPTNTRAKGALVLAGIIVAIALIAWATYLFFPTEEPKPEPTPQPCTCEEVTPEAPAELPKTGVDL